MDREDIARTTSLGLNVATFVGWILPPRGPLAAPAARIDLENKS